VTGHGPDNRDDHGTVTPDGDRVTIRFDRFLPTTPADLWDALTAPDRLARWFGADATLTPAVGGTVELRWDDPDQWVRGEILTWNPPHELAYTWTFPGETESTVRFTIAPAPNGNGSLLHLTHTRLGEAGSGYGPAWHAYLDRLAGLLRDEDIPWLPRFTELRPTYTPR
jgi:uncharacterized protein YndB with AHSA1/START domain